jgi:fido (protein-threonine AMPylation protein)
MSKPQTKAWKHIDRLEDSSKLVNGRIAALDALREEWRHQLQDISDEERVQRRQRTLRRLAIETGILERLYDIEWGLTLTLVAEGFTRDVIERAGGGLDAVTVATLNSQRDALEMVVDFVNQHRRLSPSFVKELHHAITRTQATYTATDALGQIVERELPHGIWKQWPNHVERQDGSILEYCPPEHVDSEVDNLTTWYEELEQEQIHPIVKAAWLHHRFVQIHPFADGNGRVARALTLLVMQRHQYAPLVVDRFHRGDYLKALDAANDGDLHALVGLFANLESAALASELESAQEPERGTSSSVAHTLAAQLASRRNHERTQRMRSLNVRARAVTAMALHWFNEKRTELMQVFAQQGIHDVRIHVDEATSERPEFPHGADSLPQHLWFKRQAITSARRAGHYADFGGFVGLLDLRIQIGGARLNLKASLHGAGVDSGVMALTTFGVIRMGAPEDGFRQDIDVLTPSDAFRFVHGEQMAALNSRSYELAQLLDEALSVALIEFMRYV